MAHSISDIFRGDVARLSELAEPTAPASSIAVDAECREGQARWWESSRFAALLILCAALPLLWPRIPPITDLPGHMGRWHIALALAHSPALQRYYDFHWGLIGNLGTDLAIVPLARIFGLEFGAKLLVMLIPMLTVAGMLLVARQVHGRIPPTSLFALPLAYSWPFQLGFVNFQLSQALAFLVFACWLRLAQQERFRVRAVVMVPLSWVLWLAHDFGWGLFGLLAFGSELARLRTAGSNWRRSFVGATTQCLPLALPAIAMALTPGDPSLPTSGDWFKLIIKLGWLLSILCDRWPIYDAACLLPLFMILYVAARDRRLGYSATLLWPALLCLAAFIILPRLLMGGAYVDMRMAPVTLTLALLSIRPAEDMRFAKAIAIAALAFLALRTTTTTISFASRAVAQEAEWKAIDALPAGSSVLNLVASSCATMRGADNRLDHLAGLAIVRRDIFVNEQWALRGQQLLSIRHTAAGPYSTDPSQLVYGSCRKDGTQFASAVAGFDRRAFDYVWTIGFPPGAAHAQDLALTWSNGRSAVYRVIR